MSPKKDSKKPTTTDSAMKAKYRDWFMKQDIRELMVRVMRKRNVWMGQ